MPRPGLRLQGAAGLGVDYVAAADSRPAPCGTDEARCPGACCGMLEAQLQLRVDV